MTERKPTGMPVETWVERQIRAAQERGDFDDLPGAGKPLPSRPGGALEWMVQKLRDENLDEGPSTSTRCSRPGLRPCSHRSRPAPRL
jgi:hypothetical protein